MRRRRRHVTGSYAYDTHTHTHLFSPYARADDYVHIYAPVRGRTEIDLCDDPSSPIMAEAAYPHFPRLPGQSRTSLVENSRGSVRPSGQDGAHTHIHHTPVESPSICRQGLTPCVFWRSSCDRVATRRILQGLAGRVYVVAAWMLGDHLAIRPTEVWLRHDGSVG